jgi:hypothetical protein
MADRLTILPAALLLLSTACSADPNPLLLDTVCRSQLAPNGVQSPVEPCIVTGDVEITTGVSRDVTGVRFGPSGIGELRIRLNAIAATTADSWTLEALAASTRPEGSTLFRSLTWGSCGATCPGDPADIEAVVDDNFTWVRVISDSEGTSFDQSSGAQEVVPDDATLVFRGADIDLVDIGTPGFEEQQFSEEDAVPF